MAHAVNLKLNPCWIFKWAQECYLVTFHLVLVKTACSTSGDWYGDKVNLGLKPIYNNNNNWMKIQKILALPFMPIQDEVQTMMSSRKYTSWCWRSCDTKITYLRGCPGSRRKTAVSAWFGPSIWNVSELCLIHRREQLMWLKNGIPNFINWLTCIHATIFVHI